MKNTNLKSYQEVEKKSLFGNNKNIKNYRQLALKNQLKMALFIKNFISNNHAKILEVGSGNSSLLYALNKICNLKTAEGLEISKSRHMFAQAWKKTKNFKKIINYNKSFEEFKTKRHSYDLLICNETFHLISAFNKQYIKKFLSFASKMVKKDGFLIMNIPTHRKKISQQASNPYYCLKKIQNQKIKFALYRLNPHKKRRVIKSTSIYFNSAGKNISSKTDFFYQWNKKCLKKSLKRYNFKAKFFEKKAAFFRKNKNDAILVVAKKI